MERTLEANASTLAFTGVALAAIVDRRFLVIPAIVTAFLFQHAVQGWCPPVLILRRLGFRTAREIETKRTAFKAIRGGLLSRARERQQGFSCAGRHASLRNRTNDEH